MDGKNQNSMLSSAIPQILSRGLFLLLLWMIVGIAGCGSEEGKTGTDGEVLRSLNAGSNNNRTIRFGTLPIKVHVVNIPDGEEQVARWTEATDGLISFEFVDSEPDIGITIAFDFTQPLVCGVTFQPEWSNGAITKASIKIDPKTAVPLGLVGCKQTVTHEVGHALGLLGHTQDGGLMDSEGGNGKITDQVKRIMKRLYSLPPNTDVSGDP